MELPSAPDNGPDERNKTLVRPAFVGLAAALLWAGSALLAYRRLWPYPPAHAALILGAGALWWGFIAWPVAALTHRRTVNFIVLASAVAVPFVLVTWMPGIAQPAEHRIPGAPTFAFSAAPDGSSDLYVLPDGDPTKVVALTDSSGYLYPELAPGGMELAFSAPTANGSDVWLMHLGPNWTVEGLTPLIVGAGAFYPVGWAPDGQLVVQMFAPDGSPHLKYANPSTGQVQPWMAGSQLEYSPDRQLVAFCGSHRGDTEDHDIWIANADGSDAHDVIDTLGDDTSPHWSPDGKTLAFTSNASGDVDVWTATADGNDARDVTPNTSGSRDTTWGWSPDGQIVFLSNRSYTGGVFFYFMESDGSDVKLAVRI